MTLLSQVNDQINFGELRNQKMQTKLDSIKETLANNAIGLSISWLITFTILGLNLDPVKAATLISAMCLVASLVRSYLVRRYFNSKLKSYSK